MEVTRVTSNTLWSLLYYRKDTNGPLCMSSFQLIHENGNFCTRKYVNFYSWILKVQVSSNKISGAPLQKFHQKNIGLWIGEGTAVTGAIRS